MDITLIHSQVRELEKLIACIKGVSDVVVISLDEPSGGQVFRAFVEPEDDSPMNAQSIINHCLKKSNCRRAPDSITFGKIPRTPSGKVARQVLLDMCAG